MNIRQKNAQLNHREFIDGKLTLTSRPRTVFVELTRACNLACPICRPNILSGKKYMMSSSILEKIREELFPYAQVVDLRGWGESTLDERMIDIADELIEQDVKVKLYSNCAAKKPEYWREIGKRPILVTVSIDAATPAIFEKLRLHAKFDRVVTNIHALRQAQLKRNALDDIVLGMIVSDENIDEIPKVVDLAQDTQVKIVRLDPVTRADPANSFGYPWTGVSHGLEPQLAEALSTAQELAKKYNIELQLGANLTCNASNGGYDRCVHPWSYVYIRYDGGIGFCDHLMTHEDAIYGTLENNTFMETWNNTDYQELRQEHIKHSFERLHKQGIECDWCYQHRYADAEDLIEKSYKPLVINNLVSLDDIL